MEKNERDRKTLEAIGSIYCAGNHPDLPKDEGGMCTDCRQAIERTLIRANNCPYGHKGNCEDCETHCQGGENQETIRRIMAYAAPRMMYKHPVMALRYVYKKMRGAQ